VADTYLWVGGSSLSTPADWIDLTTGQTPAGPPKFANTATINPVGGMSGIDATDSLTVGVLTLGADLFLNGWILTNAIRLAGGTIELPASGTLSVGTVPWVPGTVYVGSNGQITGTGRIDAPVNLAGTLLASGGPLGVFGTMSGTGTLAIGAGAVLFAAGSVASGLTAAFQGAAGTLELFTAATPFGATISGFAAGDVIDITASVFSTAAYSAGTLTLSGAGATLALAFAGTYAAAGFMLVPDPFGGTEIVLAGTTSLPALSAALTLGGASPALYQGSGTASTVTVSGTVALAGSLTAARLSQSGRLTVASGGTLSAGTISLAGALSALGGGVVAASAVSLAGGTLAPDGVSGVAIGTGTAGSGGSIALGGGGALSGQGRIVGALAGAGGTLTASGGLMALFGAASGRGTLAVAAGATLFLGGSVAAGYTADFLGTGATLEIFAPSSGFAGTLENFATGDALDLGFATLDSASWSAGALALKAAGTTVASIAMAGSYAGQTFAVRPDGSGGTLVSLLACFAAGTRIATPAGPRPVETLRPGDVVLTARGPRRLCWVGRRRGDSRSAPELRPVRIAPDALGVGRPVRALRLSASHAVLVGRHLVPAIALLHASAVQREAPGPVDYCHLGLESHDVIFAEGLAVETFVPGAAAPRFDVEFGARPLPGPLRARRLEGGTALEALRACLFGGPGPPPAPGTLLGHVERIVPAGAGMRLEGWACDAAAADRPVWLDLLRARGPRRRIVANRWRPDLDRAGLGEGRCAFAVTFVGGAEGLALRRAADGAPLPFAPEARRPSE
jgi:hypothetical protein